MSRIIISKDPISNNLQFNLISDLEVDTEGAYGVTVEVPGELKELVHINKTSNGLIISWNGGNWEFKSTDDPLKNTMSIIVI